MESIADTEKIVVVKLDYFSEPKNLLQTQVNALTDQYLSVFEKLKTQYEQVLGQTKDIGLMMGSDLQKLD